MRLFNVHVHTLAKASVFIGSTTVLAASPRNARVMGRSAVLSTAGLPAGTATREAVQPA